MKKLIIVFAVAAGVALLAIAQNSQQRVVVTTSAFWRQVLTNETAQGSYVAIASQTVTAASNSPVSLSQTSGYYYLADSTANTVTITLPSASGFSGRGFDIKDWKGQAGVHAITVAPPAGQTIDGTSSQSINISYSSLQVVSDGTNWFIP